MVAKIETINLSITKLLNPHVKIMKWCYLLKRKANDKVYQYTNAVFKEYVQTLRQASWWQFISHEKTQLKCTPQYRVSFRA
jgi:hypothetical protein